MTYRVFAAPAKPTATLPKPDGGAHEFRLLRDALAWAGDLGRDMRAVLIIDEHSPAKVTVRSREDAARTIP